MRSHLSALTLTPTSSLTPPPVGQWQQYQRAEAGRGWGRHEEREPLPGLQRAALFHEVPPTLRTLGPAHLPGHR